MAPKWILLHFKLLNKWEYLNQPIGLIKLKDWTGSINSLTAFDSKVHAFPTFNKAVSITVVQRLKIRSLPSESSQAIWNRQTASGNIDPQVYPPLPMSPRLRLCLTLLLSAIVQTCLLDPALSVLWGTMQLLRQGSWRLCFQQTVQKPSAMWRLCVCTDRYKGTQEWEGMGIKWGDGMWWWEHWLLSSAQYQSHVSGQEASLSSLTSFYTYYFIKKKTTM